MHNNANGDQKEYGNKFRQLAFNLKKNAPLRYALNREDVTATELVNMTPQESCWDPRCKPHEWIKTKTGKIKRQVEQ